MLENAAKDQPAYLTTKEVADLLRVKERKVYDLAAADEIPHRRITGKLLFPSAEVMAWIEGSDAADSRLRPAVLTGSHDPLLDWAVRESGSDLATLLNGSMAGVECFAQGRAALAGMHVPEPDGWNLRTVAAQGLSGCVLIAWSVRARGLLLAPGLEREIRSFADLAGRRVVMRQPQSGAAPLFQRLMQEAALSGDAITRIEGVARTESDAAAAIASGEADAALGIAAMAQQFHLGFVPLLDENFDLLVDRRAYFTEPVQALIAFTRTDGFRAKAAAMGGYDISDTGTVRWLAP
mgnify:CR=1 FL=1